MVSFEHLSKEGFNALQDVSYRSLTINQLKLTFHGFRFESTLGWDCAPHLHDFFELHYVLKGAVRTKVGDVERVCRRGQYYVMTPLSIHSHASAPEEALVSFALRWEWRRVDCDELHPELDSVKFALDCAQALVMDDTDQALARQLNEIIALALQGSSRTELLLRMAGLMVFIGRRYAALRSAERALPILPKAAERILQQTIEFVQRSYAQPLSPSDVAESVPVSYSHLARLFQQYMQTTVGRYIARVRMDKAAHLLLTTDMEILEIARATGFSSLSYFSSAFKELLGLSPRAFREYWRKRYFQGDLTIL